MTMTKVLIVEDDPMARQCFEMFIHESDQYELVASIENADYAYMYCESEKVDLILMDILTQQHANGLDSAEYIKKKHPEIKIIIVTSLPEYTFLERAKLIGVDSFWYKEVVKEPFFTLMDKTMKGERVFPDSTPTLQLGNAQSTEFTIRELDVLRELTTGASNVEIAKKLAMSVRTVKAHIQNMQEKTGFKNRTQLAINARSQGLVISDTPE